MIRPVLERLCGLEGGDASDGAGTGAEIDEVRGGVWPVPAQGCRRRADVLPPAHGRDQVVQRRLQRHRAGAQKCLPPDRSACQAPSIGTGGPRRMDTEELGAGQASQVVRRCRCSEADRLPIVAESYRPGESVSVVSSSW